MNPTDPQNWQGACGSRSLCEVEEAPRWFPLVQPFENHQVLLEPFQLFSAGLAESDVAVYSTVNILIQFPINII